MTVISYEEVLKEIEELQRRNPEGISITEMSDETGHSQNWCRIMVRKLIKIGKMRCNGRKSIETIDGRTAYVPVYVTV